MSKKIYKYVCYDNLSEKIILICRNEYQYFLDKKNVTGIGLSYKTKGGFNTFIKCIKVFVTHKISRNQLLLKDIIPMFYKGIPTDVVQSGINEVYSLTKRIRPVTGGYSISSSIQDDSGTFGCLVTDGKYYYILSNNHIIAGENKNKIGTPILQPGKLVGGKYPSDEVAILSRYIPIYFLDGINYNENIVDCAMAKIIKRSIVNSKVTFLGRIKGVSHSVLGQKVQKVGSESELTFGKINAIGVTKIVGFSQGECLFKDQILTTHMAQEGDSGSILLDLNMNALGICMSGASNNTTYNPIQEILKQLNVTIVTG